MNNRTKGSIIEEIAKKHLEKSGVRIVETNFRNRFGEIDLIGYEKNTLVFFEVKYRNTLLAGSPEASVNKKKCRKICQVSDYYRMLHHIRINTNIRYDVLAVDNNQIRWIKNAFPYIR